jgi:hypothetical protein
MLRRLWVTTAGQFAFLGASMTRALLLFCAPAMFAACDVGDVPEAAVVCEPAGINADGNHNEGTGCLNAGCHSPTSGGNGTDATKPANMILGGTLYETATGAGLGTATIIIEWGGMSKKTVSATANGIGNFYMVPSELEGITFPATVKVSLCPDVARPMISTLKDASDLNCSKAGCHGSTTPKVFWRL